MKPSVEAAIEELKRQFDGHDVSAEPDGEGGVYVVVEDVESGDQYIPTLTWIGFHLSYLYPETDVYPLYVGGDLHRTDGVALGEGMSPTTWQGRTAIQISRRSNRRDPRVDTAAVKVVKVLEWLRTR